MSQIHTDVGACERTRIARITRMQHKKKSVTIREICGTTFSSKIRGNPWNLWENILKQKECVINLPQMSQIYTDIGCVIILPRMAL